LTRLDWAFEGIHPSSLSVGFPLGSLDHWRLNDILVGIYDRTIQRLNSLDGSLAVEAHLGVHHVLHDAVTARLVLAGREHGSDGLGAADRTQ